MNYIYILLQSRGGCARLVTELRATEPKLEQRFLEKFQSLMVKWRLRGFLFLHCTTPKLHEASFMLSENFLQSPCVSVFHWFLWRNQSETVFFLTGTLKTQTQAVLTELLLSGTQLHASSDKYTKELREQWSSVREMKKRRQNGRKSF